MRVCVCVCVSVFAASFYWLFAWEAPLELMAVYIMVSLELDWLSALAGISATLLIIPMQVRVYVCVCVSLCLCVCVCVLNCAHPCARILHRTHPLCVAFTDTGLV